MSATHTSGPQICPGGFVGDLTGNVAGNVTSVTGINAGSTAAITAGTTQTQAGATAIVTETVTVTTGNANDGVLLPPMLKGQTIRIINLSANAGKIYANGTETLDGTAGNAGSTALTASKTRLVHATANGVSITLGAF